MALRINDTQMMITKPAELTADRARDQRLSGYNAEGIRQFDSDAQADLHRIQHTEETERSHIHTKADERGTGGQGEATDTAANAAPQDDLRKKAADRLLNLPVQGGEAHGFDMSV